MNAIWPQVVTAAATLTAGFGTLMITGRREARARQAERRGQVYTELIAAARAVLDFVGRGAPVPGDVSNALYLAVTAVQVTGSMRAARAAGAIWNAAGQREAPPYRYRRTGGSAPPVPGQALESGTELDQAIATFVVTARRELARDPAWLRWRGRWRRWWFQHRPRFLGRRAVRLAVERERLADERERRSPGAAGGSP